jgi:hypothetical protein
MGKDKRPAPKDNTENVRPLDRQSSIEYLTDLEQSMAGFALTLTNIILILRMYKNNMQKGEPIPEEHILTHRRAIDELAHNVGNVTMELGYSEGIVRSLNTILGRSLDDKLNMKGSHDADQENESENLPFPGKPPEPKDVRGSNDPHERGDWPRGSGA